MPGIEGFDALGRPGTRHAACADLGAGAASENSVTRGVNGVCREQGRIEKGPEPGDEEHHLGSDEQDHAVAMADLYYAGVVALVLRLADHIRPPARHGVKHPDHADEENDRRPHPTEHVMHPGDGAECHDEGRNGTDDRPRTRIDEVVVVMLDLRRSHSGLSVSGAGQNRPKFISIVRTQDRSRSWVSKASPQRLPFGLSSSRAASGIAAGSRTG